MAFNGILPAHLGLLPPKIEPFSIVWKTVFKTFETFYYSFRTSCFIFIVSLSVEELISKV